MKKLVIIFIAVLCLGSSLFGAGPYIYLRNTNMDKLLEKINEKASEGWVVSGGITQAIDSRWYTTDKSELFYYVLMYDSKLINMR
jgi:hypothetical protein